MREELYDQLAEVEERLWWHDARRRLIRWALRRFAIPAPATVLDVGCGTGGSLSLDREFAERVVAIDASPKAVELASRKNPEADVRVGDANQLDRLFAPESFDIVMLLNVLEHAWVPDESAVLSQTVRILKPGGVAVVTSAAFPFLARRHDRMAMSERRHTLPIMHGLMRQAGFQPGPATYFNLVSFPAAWLIARWDGLRGRRPHRGPLRELAVPPRPINEGMKFLMACERGLTRLFGRLPLGVTLLCVGQKPFEPRATPWTQRGLTAAPAKPQRAAFEAVGVPC